MYKVNLDLILMAKPTYVGVITAEFSKWDCSPSGVAGFYGWDCSGSVWADGKLEGTETGLAIKTATGKAGRCRAVLDTDGIPTFRLSFDDHPTAGVTLRLPRVPVCVVAGRDKEGKVRCAHQHQ